MDLQNMSLTDLRELRVKINAVTDMADRFAEELGEEPLVDLTTPARICLAVFPPVQPQFAALAETFTSRKFLDDVKAANPELFMPPAEPLSQLPIAGSATEKLDRLYEAQQAESIKTATRIGEPWTAEEDQAIIDGLAAGKSPRTIAAEIGRTLESTRFRISKPLRERIKGPPSVKLPVAPMVAAAAPLIDGALPVWHRNIIAALDSLGHDAPWTARTDLDLVELLGKGIKLASIAEDIGVSLLQAKMRWEAVTACVREPSGHMSIEGQRRLLTVLRDRLDAAKTEAA